MKRIVYKLSIIAVSVIMCNTALFAQTESGAAAVVRQLSRYISALAESEDSVETEAYINAALNLFVGRGDSCVIGESHRYPMVEITSVPSGHVTRIPVKAFFSRLASGRYKGLTLTGATFVIVNPGNVTPLEDGTYEVTGYTGINFCGYGNDGSPLSLFGDGTRQKVQWRIYETDVQNYDTEDNIVLILDVTCVEKGRL